MQSFGRAHFSKIDIRDGQTVTGHFQREQYDLVLHCAGQVAVSASLTNPRHDLGNKVLGTFNLLEAACRFCPETLFILASTNKVYDGLEDVSVVERNGCYERADFPEGIPESHPLDFHSPYAYSKVAADQYVRDYTKIYGLPTVCFRQLCIYGYRRFGVEDQGWVAWFLIAHALRGPITIFGDGKQTRDLPFVDDLIDAYCLAWQKREKVAGRVYNIGGGPPNPYSVMQRVHWLQVEGRVPAEIGFAAVQRGNQNVFVADMRKAFGDFGWRPSCSVELGIQQVNRWVNAQAELLREVFALPPTPESTPAEELPPLEIIRSSEGSRVPAANRRRDPLTRRRTGRSVASV